MSKHKSKQVFQDIFSYANIKIDGDNPWDIQVHNNRFYQRVLAEGSLGLGESYMDNWWDCKRLDELICRALKADLKSRVGQKNLFWDILRAKLLNLQNKKRSIKVGGQHYNIGNRLFENMLDKRLVYSCGYWKNANNLDDAQTSKLELICQKIELKSGMKVLDIGCGWGSFAKYAAEKYGANVIGINVSKNQVELGKKLCQGLPIEIRLQDYRDLNEKFDAVVSIGMFEHVGFKNYRTFMKIVNRCLNNSGLFLLQTIGRNDFVNVSEPWFRKYIFPNSITPTAQQITASCEEVFIIEDWHNFGADYDKTLMAWYYNFNNNWDKIKDDYNERFKRMWDYYLLSCAGGFRSRDSQLWQIVFSKKGVEGGYKSIR
jgi:cyclopropane-fatty-acyl-phospholipid synthase